MLLFVRLLHITLTLILMQDDDDEGGAAARDKSHIVEQFTGVGIKVRRTNIMYCFVCCSNSFLASQSLVALNGLTDKFWLID